jgi:methyltransferase-like protein
VANVPSSEPVHAVLKHELGLLRRVDSPGYFFHEHLENVNLPIYFYQFMTRASAAGLQYLGETDFKSMLLASLPEPAREALKVLPILQQEQYMDFLRNRRFRSTLLCQKEVAIDRCIPSHRVKQFHFAPAGQAEVRGKVDPANPSPVPFVIGSMTFTVQHCLPKAAFLRLCRSPWRFVHFKELYAGALRDLGVSPQAAQGRSELSEEALADSLTMGLMGGALQIYVHPPRYTTRPGIRPEASPLARLQAAQELTVTNQRHEQVRLDPMQQAVLYRLDGKHGREALTHEVQQLVESGKITLRQGDGSIAPPTAKTYQALLDATLQGLSQAGLLIG